MREGVEDEHGNAVARENAPEHRSCNASAQDDNVEFSCRR
jgi:hypothetical protein